MLPEVFLLVEKNEIVHEFFGVSNKYIHDLNLFTEAICGRKWHHDIWKVNG